ncbi:MAG: hypothetical protein ACP5RP_03520 [Candidatus Micrarchaeia archaeon]
MEKKCDPKTKRMLRLVINSIANDAELPFDDSTLESITDKAYAALIQLMRTAKESEELRKK